MPGLHPHTDGLVSAVALEASESAANWSQCPIWLRPRLTGGPTGEENGSSVEVQLLKEQPDKGVCEGCVLQERAWMGKDACEQYVANMTPRSRTTACNVHGFCKGSAGAVQVWEILIRYGKAAPEWRIPDANITG